MEYKGSKWSKATATAGAHRAVEMNPVRDMWGVSYLLPLLPSPVSTKNRVGHNASHHTHRTTHLTPTKLPTTPHHTLQSSTP